MTKEEIKNIVRHVFHFYEVNVENCNWTDMNEACGEIFKALEQEPKWIPVSDRLPKETESVLVYAERNAYDDKGKFRKKVIDIGWQVEGRWHIDGCSGVDVIAWMPLPEPYKAESDE